MTFPQAVYGWSGLAVTSGVGDSWARLTLIRSSDYSSREVTMTEEIETENYVCQY